MAKSTQGSPKAVAKSAQKANEMHEEIYGKPKGSDVDAAGDPQAQNTNDADGGGDIQPVEAPDAGQQVDADTKVDPQQAPEKPLSDKPIEAEEPKAKAPEEPKKSEWEEKYRTLQGKYNAEVPRLTQQLSETMARLKALEEKTKKPENPPEEKKPVVSEADLADYGPDLVDLIQRVARGEVDSRTESLIPEIETIKGQVQQSTKQQATATVYSKLDARVQDWRDINKSADFIQWLSESDPYAGDLRQNLLNNAFANGDANRVVAFFEGYKADSKLVTPKQEPRAEAPAPKANVSLEKLAGPTGGPSASERDTARTDAPTWSPAQIGKFYEDCRAGVFKNNPERKAKIEQSIAIALKEGRIAG